MKRFKYERYIRGMTAKQLGLKIGVGQQTVSCWERGERNISANSFKKLIDLGFEKKSLLNPTEEFPEN